MANITVLGGGFGIFAHRQNSALLGIIIPRECRCLNELRPERRLRQ